MAYVVRLPLFTALSAYAAYALLVLVGYVHEGLAFWSRIKSRQPRDHRVRAFSAAPSLSPPTCG